MPEKQLDSLLGELQEAVAESHELTDEQRRQLKKLQAQIRARLGEGEREPEEDPVEAVSAYIDEFQRSHPTLTMTLGRILDALNKMGI